MRMLHGVDSQVNPVEVCALASGGVVWMLNRLLDPRVMVAQPASPAVSAMADSPCTTIRIIPPDVPYRLQRRGRDRLREQASPLRVKARQPPAAAAITRTNAPR